MGKGVNLIVAIGKDGSIGRDGDLIWKISEDLKRFKALTMGHPVVMGRKTWDSLPKKPLPGRRNIVLTRRKDYLPAGAEVAGSVEEAVEICREEEPFVIGGAEIYKAFLPHISKLYLTEVEDECQDADAFLDIDLSHEWQMEEISETASTPEGVRYRYVTYQRKPDEGGDNK